jgi:molybdopterin converting factor small subunit
VEFKPTIRGLGGRVKITVKLFALAKQLANSDTLVVSVAEPATVRDVRRAIGEACPPLAALMRQMLIAVDSDYARDDTPVNAKSEVACIPPVSGGGRESWWVKDCG